MPERKSAQVNIRFTPMDLNYVKAEAAKEETPFTRWCEQVILDEVARRRSPKAPQKKQFAADPRQCEHPRLPKPDFGMESSVCPDCGRKIQLVGRQLGRIV